MDDFYSALLARDYRFDGKFFVAVKTTGVYCRPICPAKPKRENVEFFTDAIAAELAGYRPCLRCRPESAPFSPAWFGKKAIVQRALRLIANNELYQTDEDQFAGRLGVSARHLRRLFRGEIGATPKRIADNNRLNFARKLLVETEMPIAAVALTAGFSSLRRFNDAFKKRFDQPPSRLRRARCKNGREDGIELLLSFRPPYDWQTIIRFYQTHPIPGVEDVGEDCFRRVFRIGESLGFLQVRHVAGEPQLRLRILTEDPKVLFEVVTRVRKMFDLDSDPMLIAQSFAQVPFLSSLYHRFPGLRLPRGWDPFETAICSILGQGVSAEQRRILVKDIVRGYGDEIEHPASGEKKYLFPGPEVLAKSDLRALRTTRVRREAIREFSRHVLDGAISLSEAQDPVAFRKALLQTKGLGAWSAEYISLRAIGDTDAFPRTDLILKRALALHPELDLECVKPWRSYAAIYLWKEYAHALSKTRRRNKDESVLQGNEIAGGQPDVVRELRRARRGPIGSGTSRPSEARIGEARSAPDDSVRG